MKRIAATALALALTAAAGSAAFAAQDYYGGRYDDQYRYDTRYARDFSRTDVAQVVRAVPMADPYASYQRQECWNERTNAYDDGYYRDSSGRLYYRDTNADGTLAGAVVGGALGNLAGKGDGRKAATIGGAVIGAIIGNNIDRNNGPGARDGQYEYRDSAGVVRRCRTVTDYDGPQWSGYDVTYRYAGRTYRAVTPYRPGSTLRVAVEVRPLDDGMAYRR